MTEHNRPALERTIPTAADPVTPATVAIFAVLATGLVLLRTHAEHIAPFLFVAIAYLVSPAADWLEGKRRMAATTVAAGLALVGAILTWELMGLWLLIPAPLVWWVPWAIGRGRGSKKSNKAKVDHGLALVRQGITPIIQQHAPPGTKVRKPILEAGTVKVGFKLPSSTPKGSAPMPADPSKTAQGLASKIANDLGKRVGEIDVVDCARTIAAGEAVIKLRAATPFGKKLGDRPPLADWPAGCVPIGEYAYGTVAYLGRQHVVIGAETGAGKSWLLENIVWGNLQRGHIVALIDPKRVAFAKYQNCVGAKYACEPLDTLNLLREVAAEMDRRYRKLKQDGHEEWTDAMGPLVTLVVDETADLLGTTPTAAEIMVRLYQLARAAGIQVVAATQRPDAQSIPPLVKANAPTIIGLRVANDTAERITLGEDATRRGIRLKDRSLPAGRAWVQTVGAEDQWVQVYRTPRADGLPTIATPTQPAQPPTPDPRYAGETQVAEVADNPTSATNATPDPDTRTTRQIIEDNLYPDDPITAVVLAKITGTSEQNVRKILAKMVDEGVAEKQRGGWVSVASKDRAA